MTTSQFEEGSLEFRLVQGIFNHINSKLQLGAFDVYNTFGVIVKGEMNLNYKIEHIKLLAEYIRTHDYKFETLEYLPIAFDFNLQ